jgi:uncharacterized protein YkwD
MIRSFFGLTVLAAAATALLAQEKTEPPASGKGKSRNSEVKLSGDEKALIELANKARAEAKLSQLKINPLLCKVAKQHSQNMAKQEKMEHVLDGKRPAQRVSDAGYDYRKVGENLAKSSGDANAPASPPADIHQKWMDSKGHRANILEPKYTEIGISICVSPNGSYYYTVLYAVPRK